MLLAPEVRGEGPAGQLEHLQCEASTDRFRAQTVPEGVRQIVELPPASRGIGEHIRARLDSMEIRAEYRLEILERPEPCDVVVTAVGDVYWADPATGVEERGDSWRRVGVVER
jgi:hypothetical protein